MFHLILFALLVFVWEFLENAWVVVFYFSIMLNITLIIFFKAASDHAEQRSMVPLNQEHLNAPVNVVHVYPDPPVQSYPTLNPVLPFPAGTGFRQAAIVSNSSSPSSAVLRSVSQRSPSIAGPEEVAPPSGARHRRPSQWYSGEQWDK